MHPPLSTHPNIHPPLRLHQRLLRKKHTSPSPKKRKAGSDAATLKKRTSRRLNVTKSVSKSSNISQQAQSDDAAQEEENLTGGLKLLKHGMETMAQVTTIVIHGQRIVVQLTAKGEPIGKEARNMQSFIGVLARTKIPISILDWRDVDEDEKQKIWESVQEAFVVPKKLRKSVIASAATKWRDFKSRLTSKYIMRYMNDVNLIEFPPDDYRFITKDVWQEFVADRLSASFQELYNEQVEKRKKNKYNHRLSRKGYCGMRAEIAATLSPEELEELGTYIYWIKARQGKDGKFLDVAVEEAVERIKMEAEGKFKLQGMKDVLTEALGNPEHRGRVRGVGGNVKPETYFDLPRRQRGRKKVSEEERESLFAKEKAKWEEEMKKKQAELLAEAEAKWEKKFAMLEEKLEGKLLASESPQTVTAVNNDLADGRDGSILEDVSASKESTNAEGVQKGQLDCKLAFDMVENIVAFRRIVDKDLDPNKQTIHGIPLGAENVRVSIIVPIIGHHLLPYLIKYEIMTVKDALGSIVAWPRNLVIKAAIDMEDKTKPKTTVTMRRWTRQQASPKYLDDEDLEHQPSNLPRQLLTLCTWANTELRNRATIFITFPAEIFSHPTKAVIFRNDLHAMTHMTELTSSCIIFYISYLNEVLKKSQMTDIVGFIDPNHTGALGCRTPTERSKNLMNRFKDGTNCQIYLVPHNSGNHWTLSVVDPHRKKVYWLDPLKWRLSATSEWQDVVDNGIKFYYAQKMNKSSRVSVQWIPILGIPEQKDGKTCAYLIMCYMNDIIADKDLEFSTTVYAFDAKGLRYTPEQIDKVRAEWAKQVLIFKV
ncbi:hypothetical protein ACLB2K_007532 [Fragaria x ananassa]